MTLAAFFISCYGDVGDKGWWLEYYLDRGWMWLTEGGLRCCLAEGLDVTYRRECVIL